MTSTEHVDTEPQRVWMPASEALLDWSEDFHDLLLRDQLRMTSYRTAITEAVTDGMVVADIGAGTGILSQWALEAGAARVYGIEINESILATAIERIDMPDRFHPVHGLSTETDLPERVDLVISEILGNLADNEGCVPILRDARERLIRREGRLLPYRVESYLVPVEAAHAYRQVRDGDAIGGTGVRSNGTRPFDLYYDAVVPVAQGLAAPRLIRAYEFTADEVDEYRVQRSFPVWRRGTFTGFKGSFAAALTPEVTLDISGDGVGHGAASASWKHCYLPIEEPIQVDEGDQIVLTFERSRPERSLPFSQSYGWSGKVHRAGRVIGRFEQGTRPVGQREVRGDG